ncbi:MAG: BrnT family toxin [SAR324 cluster bacterium]|nr:BrnT family toxin [SAR324 cluster bacterium]
MIFDSTGFDWDDGNSDKNWDKHQVTKTECEGIFFNQPLLTQKDIGHSQVEKRFYALGITNSQRELFIAFVLRKRKVRVISARNMSRKERSIYAKANSEV